MTGTLETLAQEKQDKKVQDTKVDVFGASLSRRGFVAAGGALLASFVPVRSSSAQEETPGMRGVPTSKVSSDPFDLIVSNPPYVGRKEKETLMREVRNHEPELALYGGEQGYELYADLISQAAHHLKPGGLIVLELGHNSLPAVQPMLDPPNWANVAVTKDLAGIDRVIAAERT